jgi:hypothetical protein
LGTTAAALAAAGRTGTVAAVLPLTALRRVLAWTAAETGWAAERSLRTPPAGAPSLAVALGATSARAIAVEFAPAPTTRLTNRELRDLALGRLSLGARKRGANQSSMDGSFVVGRTGLGGIVCHNLVTGFGRLLFAGGSLYGLTFNEGRRFVCGLFLI